MCVYCNTSQKTSHRVKNNSHSTSSRTFCSLHAVTLFYQSEFSFIPGSGAGPLAKANDDNQYDSVEQEKLRKATEAEANNGEDNGAASGSDLPSVYAVVDKNNKKRKKKKEKREKEGRRYRKFFNTNSVFIRTLSLMCRRVFFSPSLTRRKTIVASLTRIWKVYCPRRQLRRHFGT